MTMDRRQKKEMFAMRSNPYLNTPLHRVKGIKKLISIQVVLDVLDGALPRDFTAGCITLSLAVDRIYLRVVLGWGGGPVEEPAAYIQMYTFAFEIAQVCLNSIERLPGLKPICECLGATLQEGSPSFTSCHACHNWSPGKPRADLTSGVNVEKWPKEQRQEIED